MKKYKKVKWSSFIHWQKKIFRNRQFADYYDRILFFKLKHYSNFNPCGPGCLSSLDMLYYLEAYATVMGVYYWNFSEEVRYKVMMDEMWTLRKKVRSLNEEKVEKRFEKEKREEIFKLIGDPSKEAEGKKYIENEFQYISLPIYYNIFDHNKVQNYYEANKSDVDKFFIKNPQFSQAANTNCFSNGKNFTLADIADNDIIKFLCREKEVECLNKVYEELNRISEDLGKYIFSPIYITTTFCGDENNMYQFHNEDRRSDKAFAKALKEYESLSPIEKRTSIKPTKYPAILHWDF